jgi:hypothetical protein
MEHSLRKHTSVNKASEDGQGGAGLLESSPAPPADDADPGSEVPRAGTPKVVTDQTSCYYNK